MASIATLSAALGTISLAAFLFLSHGHIAIEVVPENGPTMKIELSW
jgi:hypothetical protein